jgi:hypothetical protein
MRRGRRYLASYLSRAGRLKAALLVGLTHANENDQEVSLSSAFLVSTPTLLLIGADLCLLLLKLYDDYNNQIIIESPAEFLLAAVGWVSSF